MPATRFKVDVQKGGQQPELVALPTGSLLLLCKLRYVLLYTFWGLLGMLNSELSCE